MWYAPHARDAYGKEEIKAVENALINGWLTTGPITGKFENEIASLYGKKHGLFVNSGSSANLIALEIMDFPAGSEIITPACTFNTTVSPIIQKGLVPVFVDVKPGYYTLDPKKLAAALSSKTVAVMAPHLIGNLVDLTKIQNFCKKHKLVFIEDSCDTIGAHFMGKKTGKWSDIVTTSFYASHLITTGGAGGMLILNDKKLRERARVFRDWGGVFPVTTKKSVLVLLHLKLTAKHTIARLFSWRKVTICVRPKCRRRLVSPSSHALILL